MDKAARETMVAAAKRLFTSCANTTMVVAVFSHDPTPLIPPASLTGYGKSVSGGECKCKGLGMCG